MDFTMSMVKITNFTIDGIITPGNDITVSFTLKNISGVKITKLSVWLEGYGGDFLDAIDTKYFNLGYVVGKGMTSGETVNLANNASKTFTKTIQ